jgi:hypothetical protein
MEFRMKRTLSRADIQQLHTLGLMKDKGILTPEEFASEKSFVLNQVTRLNDRRQAPSRLAMWVLGGVAGCLLVIAAVGIMPGGSVAHQQPNPEKISAQH